MAQAERSQPDTRRIPPQKLVQLLNSDPRLGTVISLARLKKHRLAAGLRISADGETVDFLKYTAWLCQQRHVAPVEKPEEADDFAAYLAQKRSELDVVLSRETGDNSDG